MCSSAAQQILAARFQRDAHSSLTPTAVGPIEVFNLLWTCAEIGEHIRRRVSTALNLHVMNSSQLTKSFDASFDTCLPLSATSTSFELIPLGPLNPLRRLPGMTPKPQ
jgi:hypothetical protein